MMERYPRKERKMTSKEKNNIRFAVIYGAICGAIIMYCALKLVEYFS